MKFLSKWLTSFFQSFLVFVVKESCFCFLVVNRLKLSIIWGNNVPFYNSMTLFFVNYQELFLWNMKCFFYAFFSKTFISKLISKKTVNLNMWLPFFAFSTELLKIWWLSRNPNYFWAKHLYKIFTLWSCWGLLTRHQRG